MAERCHVGPGRRFPPPVAADPPKPTPRRGLFTGLSVLFWSAEALFGLLVLYWVITRGVDSDRDTPVELEDSSVTITSLGMWGLLFGAIVLGVIVGA